MPRHQRPNATIINAYRSRLTENQFSVLLACADGRTMQQAAAQLGVPVGTIKSRLHRAAQALDRLIERGTVPAELNEATP